MLNSKIYYIIKLKVLFGIFILISGCNNCEADCAGNVARYFGKKARGGWAHASMDCAC